jgi:hypothetical protein
MSSKKQSIKISDANRTVYKELAQEIVDIADELWGEETDTDYMVEINSIYRVEKLLYTDDEETFNEIIEDICNEIDELGFKLSKEYKFIKE